MGCWKYKWFVAPVLCRDWRLAKNSSIIATVFAPLFGDIELLSFFGQCYCLVWCFWSVLFWLVSISSVDRFRFGCCGASVFVLVIGRSLFWVVGDPWRWTLSIPKLSLVSVFIGYRRISVFKFLTLSKFNSLIFRSWHPRGIRPGEGCSKKMPLPSPPIPQPNPPPPKLLDSRWYSFIGMCWIYI